jgi:hypothetical protein
MGRDDLNRGDETKVVFLISSDGKLKFDLVFPSLSTTHVVAAVSIVVSLSLKHSPTSSLVEQNAEISETCKTAAKNSQQIVFYVATNFIMHVC